MTENTQAVAGQTRFDTVFEAILAKNIIAREGKVELDYLESIERALALAASLLNKRDNYPLYDHQHQTNDHQYQNT